MDGRGRELQQVAAGSRFWWRALDAQTPPPGMHRTSAFFRPAHRARLPAPADPFTLQVPRSDRRKNARQVKSRRSNVIALTLMISVTACAVATLALAFPTLTLRDVESSARQFATRGLITAGFGIDQVSLTGQRYTLDQDVFDALDLANVKTFAALDTNAALKRIERISWVDTAQISRVFPGMLTVQIQERAPAAIWTRGNKTYLIDATGRTLGPVPAGTGWVLPRIAGEGANADVPLLLTAIARHKEIEAQFNHAERIAERRWSLVLRNGSCIELGADREVEGLDEVASNSTLRQALTGAPSIVDVRTAGRAAIRPATATAPVNGASLQTSMVKSP
jgi:cell division protein FtsQ